MACGSRVMRLDGRAEGSAAISREPLREFVGPLKELFIDQQQRAVSRRTDGVRGAVASVSSDPCRDACHGLRATGHQRPLVRSNPNDNGIARRIWNSGWPDSICRARQEEISPFTALDGLSRDNYFDTPIEVYCRARLIDNFCRIDPSCACVIFRARCAPICE